MRTYLLLAREVALVCRARAGTRVRSSGRPHEWTIFCRRRRRRRSYLWRRATNRARRASGAAARRPIVIVVVVVALGPPLKRRPQSSGQSFFRVPPLACRPFRSKQALASLVCITRWATGSRRSAALSRVAPRRAKVIDRRRRRRPPSARARAPASQQRPARVTCASGAAAADSPGARHKCRLRRVVALASIASTAPPPPPPPTKPFASRATQTTAMMRLNLTNRFRAPPADRPICRAISARLSTFVVRARACVCVYLFRALRRRL